MRIFNTKPKELSCYIDEVLDTSCKTQEEAHQFLNEFYSYYKNTDFNNQINIGGKNGYFGYLEFCWKISEALNKNDYCKACNELERMGTFVDLTQKRIHVILTEILKKGGRQK